MLIYMFPGQGSQYHGMGKNLFEKFPEYVEIASNTLGYDIVSLCINQDDERINQTIFTQPLLYTICVLYYLAETRGPDLVLGHSLGLYPALFAAGVFSFKQGLEIVIERACLMSKATGGAMLAVLGWEYDKLSSFMVHNELYDIDIANDNTFTQIVVSGKADSLLKLRQLLEKSNVRSILLPVSGAFHSRYMQTAMESFFDFLKGRKFETMSLPVLSSTDGEILREEYLLEEMAYQLVNPVRWRQVMTYLLKQYPAAEFKEIGPKETLTQMAEQITAYLNRS